MRVISPFSLADNDICRFAAGYGAPSVGSEQKESGTEIFTALEAVNKVPGYTDFQAVIMGK